jgi:uncharacterized protein YceK
MRVRSTHTAVWFALFVYPGARRRGGSPVHVCHIIIMGKIAEENIRNILISRVIVLVVCVVLYVNACIMTQRRPKMYLGREWQSHIFTVLQKRGCCSAPLSTALSIVDLPYSILVCNWTLLLLFSNIGGARGVSRVELGMSCAHLKCHRIIICMKVQNRTHPCTELFYKIVIPPWT